MNTALLPEGPHGEVFECILIRHPDSGLVEMKLAPNVVISPAYRMFRQWREQYVQKEMRRRLQ